MRNKIGLFVVASMAALAVQSVASAFVLVPAPAMKWGAAVYGTPGGLVEYSFATGAGYATGEAGSGGTVVDLTPFMPAGYKAQIAAAFNAWSSIANIQFVEVPDGGQAFNAAGATADIRIGGHIFDGANGTLAHGFFPPANGVSAAGDIHFDIDETWKIGQGAAPGFDIFTVAAHEIGHAIGLDHEVNNVALMNAFYTEAFNGLQPDDIAGAQFIYGPAIVAVPEPGTIALFAVGGVFGIALAKRRRELSLR